MKGREVYYSDYLQLGQLLSAQDLESERAGKPAHDEMLFIITHQAYELWFKQILWEIDAVNAAMGDDVVDERDLSQAVKRLERITEIQRLLLDHVPVLETMTPLDFMDFREFLVPASGFQSVQFRLIEYKLGVDPDHRHDRSQAYAAVLNEADAAALEAAAEEPSLLSHVERWLERTPFVRTAGFDFWTRYQEAVEEVLEREERAIREDPSIDEESRARQLSAHEMTLDSFRTAFDRERYDELREKGERQLTHEAFVAALMITLYGEQPAMQLPHRLLGALVTIAEGFTAWRQRHALMVYRTIGAKLGTGGTTGHRYLSRAAERPKVFRDLYDMSTFFLARHQLPKLPTELEHQLGFRFTDDRAGSWAG